MLSFFKDDWIPFVCSTDVSIEIASTKVPIRTRGDGHWKKFTYQDATFTLTLSGLLKFDGENWTGWDMIDVQMNFSHVLVRCSFDDENGNVRTMQGYVMIETSTIGYSPGNLVKEDFQLQGNGKLDIFDGYVPCGSAIVSITVTGQEDEDGIVHVSYSYLGDVYQIKYRLDNTGDYAYAAADLTLDIPSLSLGDHSIEIIPVCINGYEGTGLMQAFMVTQALVCNTTVTDITIDLTAKTAIPVYTGSATQMRYSIDAGIDVIVPITTIIPLTGLSVGPHFISITPLCSIDGQILPGNGFSKAFTIAIQPAQSIIEYQFETVTGGSFMIFIGGTLTVLKTSTAFGSITVPTGGSIKVSATGTSKHRSLEILDTTLSTSLFNALKDPSDPTTLQFIWTPNGDSYKINAFVTN